MTAQVIEGVALFSGESSRVDISRFDGPSILRTENGGGPISEWSRVSAFRTTAIEHASGARIACVEHLFAALAAFGAHEGVDILVRGSELPILDGASRAWCALLAALEVPKCEPKLRVVRDGDISIGSSKYLLFSTEKDLEISSTLEMDDARPFAASLSKRASWNGARESFISEIAAARTFLFARDVAEFAASGAGAHISEESFVIIGEENAVAHGAPFSADEPARHKLIDLIGDFFLHGGPPIGRVDATRPGHAKNHEAIAIALKQGILARI